MASQAKQLKQMVQMMAKLGDGRTNRKDRRSDSPHPAAVPASERKAKRSEPVMTPPSSRKPSKRERSDSVDMDAQKLKDYEKLISKITSAEGGDLMLDGFMGKDFTKKHRGESDDEMDEDSEDEEAGSESMSD